MVVGASRLEILKALGDNTRYAIYLELARSPRPLATAEIADTLGLHPNTVRPHLERMRDVGLLEVGAVAGGSVGRPQNRYQLAADAPSLGLESSAFPMLARMLIGVAELIGVDSDAAADVAAEEGRRLAGRVDAATPCLEATEAMLVGLGFDPERVGDDAGVVIAFSHCPFGELAESNPDLVCSLHRGLLTGFVGGVGGAAVTTFHDRSHREPCLAELAPD
jgi:predicted ArsR family transcriptional regulator